ncbi:Harbinger transposase-derived protein [Dillenia turbinata]|uniref:Harbinger transposase-derived protein n=1 Tax=Dillenia turbinata TaxID=194707 RepID=A0AAN8UZR7_9MAGN
MLRSELITPFKYVRYHLKEYSTHSPQNAKELFNLRHASLQNVIERAFGVPKIRFPIIGGGQAATYRANTMTNIILACCILNYFLLEVDPDDDILAGVNCELMEQEIEINNYVDSVQDADYEWEFKIDGTWTTIAYTDIVKVYNEKFDFTIDKEHVKKHLKTLKNNFGICYDLFHGNNGFGWNPDTKLFEVKPSVWKEKIEANPDMGKWKHLPISHYDKLEMLFSKDRANRKGAISVKEKVRQWAREVDESFVVVDSGFCSFENMCPSDVPSKMIEVAEALKEDNAITEKGIVIAEKQVQIAKTSQPRFLSEKELFAELKNISVPQHYQVDALLNLLKNPIDMRAFFCRAY